MTPVRRRMLEDMQLRGLAPKTQQAYIRAVRQVAEHNLAGIGPLLGL
jgi:integrase/recombinase XerD